MELNLARLYADQTGETHLTNITLPESRPAEGGVSPRSFGLWDIPATSLAIWRWAGRRPADDFHSAPRRQFVVVLRGAFEITTTQGHRRRFDPGDCLFAEDLDSKGHLFHDVGDQPLAMLRIGVDPDWDCPGA
jgi:hypothetical protein